MGECCPAVRPEMRSLLLLLGLATLALAQRPAGLGVGQALALTGEGQPVLMVQGPSGHRGASVDHLPAATGTLHFAPTEALPRSQKGLDPALTAAPLPVGEPVQSARMVLP